MNGRRNGIDAELFERMEQSGKLLHEFEKLNDDMNRFYWEYILTRRADQVNKNA